MNLLIFKIDGKYRDLEMVTRIEILREYTKYTKKLNRFERAAFQVYENKMFNKSQNLRYMLSEKIDVITVTTDFNATDVLTNKALDQYIDNMVLRQSA